MELLTLGVVLVLALGVVIFFIIFLTRGVFARDLTLALKRVNQQERELQEKADILEQRLGQLERDYQAKIKRAEAEAARIVQEAKNQAMNIRTVAIEEAKHRARQLLLEVEQGKAQLKAELARELDGKTVAHACELLRAILPPSELTSLHGTLIGELWEVLKALDVSTFRTAVEQVEVATAQPLTPAQSQRLSQWLTASFGAALPLEVKTDAALVAGCIVRLGPTVVDNSLPNRLRQQGEPHEHIRR